MAAFTCRAQGARLLEIRSRREYNALTQWVTGHNLWLGSTTSKTLPTTNQEIFLIYGWLALDHFKSYLEVVPTGQLVQD